MLSRKIPFWKSWNICEYHKLNCSTHHTHSTTTSFWLQARSDFLRGSGQLYITSTAHLQTLRISSSTQVRCFFTFICYYKEVNINDVESPHHAAICWWVMETNMSVQFRTMSTRYLVSMYTISTQGWSGNTSFYMMLMMTKVTYNVYLFNLWSNFNSTAL